MISFRVALCKVVESVRSRLEPQDDDLNGFELGGILRLVHGSVRNGAAYSAAALWKTALIVALEGSPRATGMRRMELGWQRISDHHIFSM